MSQTIRDKISPLQILSKSEINNVSKSFKGIQFKKNEYLVKAGACLDQLVFLKKGLLGHCSATDYDSNNEPNPNQGFTFENNFLFYSNSFVHGEPSKLSIVALEDSEVLMLSISELEGIYESIPGFTAVLRELLQKEQSEQEKKNGLIRIQSTQKRYDYFQRNFAMIASSLSEKQKALFLNIPESELSRIKKKISVGTTF